MDKGVKKKLEDTGLDVNNIELVEGDKLTELLDTRVLAEYWDRQENRRSSYIVMWSFAIINVIVFYFIVHGKHAGSPILMALFISGMIVEMVYMFSAQINVYRCQEMRQFMRNQKENFNCEIALGKIVKVGMYKAIVEVDDSYIKVDIAYRPLGTKLKIGNEMVYLNVKNNDGEEMNLMMEGDIVYEEEDA